MARWKPIQFDGQTASSNIDPVGTINTFPDKTYTYVNKDSSVHTGNLEDNYIDRTTTPIETQQPTPIVSLDTSGSRRWKPIVFETNTQPVPTVISDEIKNEAVPEGIDPALYVQLRSKGKTREEVINYKGGLAPAPTGLSGFIDSMTDWDQKDIPLWGSGKEAAYEAGVARAYGRFEKGTSKPGDKEKMAAYYKEEEKQSKLGENVGYSAGETIKGSLRFMGELLPAIVAEIATLTAAPALDTLIVAQIAKLGARKTIQKMMKDKLFKASVLNAAKTIAKKEVPLLAKQFAITAPTNITLGTAQRMVGTVDLNTGQVLEEGQSIGEALVNATTGHAVELLSERGGGVTGKILGQFAAPVKKVIVKTSIFKAIQKLMPSVPESKIVNLLKKSGWNGIVGEWFEERDADALNHALASVGLGDQPFTGLTMDQIATEIIAFSVMGGGMRVIQSEKVGGRLFKTPTEEVPQATREDLITSQLPDGTPPPGAATPAIAPDDSILPTTPPTGVVPTEPVTIPTEGVVPQEQVAEPVTPIAPTGKAELVAKVDEFRVGGTGKEIHFVEQSPEEANVQALISGIIKGERPPVTVGKASSGNRILVDGGDALTAYKYLNINDIPIIEQTPGSYAVEVGKPKVEVVAPVAETVEKVAPEVDYQGTGFGATRRTTDNGLRTNAISEDMIENSGGNITKKVKDILKSIQGKPDAEITIYRAAPKGSGINSGDWISLDKNVADSFTTSSLGTVKPDYEVQTLKVKASEVIPQKSAGKNKIYDFSYQPKEPTKLDKVKEVSKKYTTDKQEIPKKFVHGLPIEDMRKKLMPIIGEINEKDIFPMKRGKELGKYIDGMIGLLTLKGDVSEIVGYHEAYHYVSTLLMTKAENAEQINWVKENKQDEMDKLRKADPKAAAELTEDELAEEVLANEFARYVIEKQNKKAGEEKPKTWTEKMQSFFEKLIKKLTGISDNRELADAYFEKIRTGEFAKRNEAVIKPEAKAPEFQNLSALKQDEEIEKTLTKAKGLSAKDVMAKYPNLNLKRDVKVTDIHGKKSVIEEGEALTPYQLKGNKVLLQDGETYIVSKNQYQNIRGQSAKGEAVPFAPELEGVDETTLGNMPKVDDLEWKKSGDDLTEINTGVIIKKLPNKEYQIYSKDGKELLKGDYWTDLDSAKKRVSFELKTNPSKIQGQAKYTDYQLPDGKNYKEILIKAPESKVARDTASNEIKKFWKKIGGAKDVADMTSEESSEYRKLLSNDEKAITEIVSNRFKSAHWDEPNVISHLRMNEREFKGNKVSFMEELQSDWSAAGREKGFEVFDTTNPERLLPEGWNVKTDNGDVFYVVNKDGNLVPNKLGDGNADGGNKKVAIGRAVGEEKLMGDYKPGVPSNPLLKKWQELTIKRALQESVKNKSDYFAWITGEQTSARYNLSTQVDKIDWEKSNREGENKVIYVVGKDNRDFSIKIDNSGKITEKTKEVPEDWKGKKIDEVFGKGLADKIMADEKGTLSGEGLKFGGEWASNIYDRQVKNIVEDLTGSKVEVLEMGLPIGEETEKWYSADQHQVAIKPTELNVGKEITTQGGGNHFEDSDVYIITEILKDGKFKAVNKNDFYSKKPTFTEGGYGFIPKEKTGGADLYYLNRSRRTIDISQKTTTQQAIKLTPEIKAKIKGEAPVLKKPSGRVPFSKVAEVVRQYKADKAKLFTSAEKLTEEEKTQEQKMLEPKPRLVKFNPKSDKNLITESGEYTDTYWLLKKKFLPKKLKERMDANLSEGNPDSTTIWDKAKTDKLSPVTEPVGYNKKLGAYVVKTKSGENVTLDKNYYDYLRKNIKDFNLKGTDANSPLIIYSGSKEAGMLMVMKTEPGNIVYFDKKIKEYKELKDTIKETVPKTQKEKVAAVIKESPKTIQDIAKETKILEPNVRRILGVGAKEGTFERIDKGVYILNKGGKQLAYIETGDATEVLPRLAKEGFKADMIFLDIPYKTPAVTGGNRGVKYNLVTVDQFKTVLKAVKDIARNENTPVFHMFSNAKSGLKAMQKYNDAVVEAGFKPVAKGDYTKFQKDGVTRVRNMRGNIIEPEGIIMFTKSGKADMKDPNLTFRLIRPRGYQTEKPAEMVKKMIEMSTKEGDVVLDPFAGSGVVPAEAVKAGREAVAIEKSIKAVEEFIKPRVEAAAKEVKVEPEKKPDIEVKAEEAKAKEVPQKYKELAKVTEKNKKVEDKIVKKAKSEEVTNAIQEANDAVDLERERQKMLLDGIEDEQRKKVDALTEKILEGLEAAELTREEQTAVYAKARAARFAKAKAIGKKVGGVKGFYIEKAQLKGPLPQVNYTSLKKFFSEKEIDEILDAAKNDPRFSLTESLTLREGILKLFGDFGGSVPTPGQLALMTKFFGKKVTNKLIDLKTRKEKIWEGVFQLLNMPRTIMSSYDLSASLRQGIFAAPRFRKEWYSAFEKQFGWFASEKSFQEAQRAIFFDPIYKYMVKSDLSITEMDAAIGMREEGFQSQWAEIIPGVRASGRAYTAFANTYRASIFRTLFYQARADGLKPEKDEKLLRNIAGLANNATGRGSLGKAEGANKVLNVFFFSPRLMMSRLALLNPAYYVGLDPFTRKEALKTLFTFTGTMLTILGLLSMWPDDDELDVGWDPRSADFMKIKMGDTRLDVMGGFQQYLKLAAQLTTGKLISSSTGKVTTLGEGYRALNRFDILLRFFQMKEAPVASFATQWMQGESAIGEEFVISKEIGQRFIPMVISDVYDLADKNPGLLPLAPLSFFGFGTQTYGPTSTNQMRDLAETKKLSDIEFSNLKKLMNEELKTGKKTEKALNTLIKTIEASQEALPAYEAYKKIQNKSDEEIKSALKQYSGADLAVVEKYVKRDMRKLYNDLKGTTKEKKQKSYNKLNGLEKIVFNKIIAEN